MRNALRITVALIFGFLGGWLGQEFFRDKEALAIERLTTASEIQLVSATGKTYAVLNRGKGQEATLALLNSNGKRLLDLGINEAGLPFIRLASDKSYPVAKAEFSLRGQNQAAVLVLKDNSGKDRLVMGLDPEGVHEEPFFYYTDKDQKAHSLFGQIQNLK